MVDLIIENPEGPIQEQLPGPDMLIYVRPGNIEVKWQDPSFSSVNIGRKIAKALSDLGEVGEGEKVIRYSNIRTYENTIKLLEEEPELLEILERIIQWEEVMSKKGDSIYKLGFRAEEVFADPRTLTRLVPWGILMLSYKSANDTRYRAYNLEELKKAVQDWKEKRPKTTVEEVKMPESSSELFDSVVGHDDVKEVIWRAINAEKPAHILLCGPPASAKSLLLESLMKLPGAKLVLGSGLSKAGLYDVIFDEQPRFLIIDEIDKIDDSDNLTCLLSLMERGIVIETKHRKHRSIQLKCTVLAGANRIDKLPPELLSRFLVLNFRPYTAEEFTEVVVHVLTCRENIPEHLALYIAQKCMRDLMTKDPRDAIKIARLIKQSSKEEVDKIIDLIAKRK